MKIYTHSNSAIRGRQRQFKFTSPELIKSGRGKSSPIPREGGQPFDRRLTTIYRITSPSDLCDPVASRVARHFSASRRDTISPTRHTRHNSPPPPLLVESVCAARPLFAEMIKRWKHGWFLAVGSSLRTVKGSALIKYNSSEAAVSSVNLDEQRMNWFGREARERERERFKRGSPTVPGLRISSIDRLSRVAGGAI